VAAPPSRLRWVSAAHAHREQLTQFICTDPARRQYEKHRGKFHPRPYELEVQSHLRGLKVPVGDDEALLLGYDEHGLAAAAHFGFDDTLSQLIIWALARAQRTAGQHYGREALAMVLYIMENTKKRYDLDCGVFAYVDPRNDASRAAMRDAGFEFLATYDGYEGWVRDI
jgi:hypothetical protein